MPLFDLWCKAQVDINLRSTGIYPSQCVNPNGRTLTTRAETFSKGLYSCCCWSPVVKLLHAAEADVRTKHPPSMCADTMLPTFEDLHFNVNR